MGARRTAGQNDRDARRNGSQPVTRAEFEEVVELLDERGRVIDEIRREVDSTCRDLTENVRRELQTQFTRIVQIQQQIDELKRHFK